MDACQEAIIIDELPYDFVPIFDSIEQEIELLETEFKRAAACLVGRRALRWSPLTTIVAIPVGQS